MAELSPAGAGTCSGVPAFSLPEPLWALGSAARAALTEHAITTPAAIAVLDFGVTHGDTADEAGT